MLTDGVGRAYVVERTSVRRNPMLESFFHDRTTGLRDRLLDLRTELGQLQVEAGVYDQNWQQRLNLGSRDDLRGELLRVRVRRETQEGRLSTIRRRLRENPDMLVPLLEFDEVKSFQEIRTQLALAELGTSAPARERAEALGEFAESLEIELPSATARGDTASAADTERSVSERQSLEGADWLAIQNADRLTLQLFAVNALEHVGQQAERGAVDSFGLAQVEPDAGEVRVLKHLLEVLIDGGAQGEPDIPFESDNIGAFVAGRENPALLHINLAC